MIDICASGGRQLDIEAISRGFPLWRSDYAGHPTASQCHTYGLMYWLPLHATTVGNLGTSTDYEVRSGMSSGLQFGLQSDGDAQQKSTDYSQFPFARAKSILDQQREVQRFFYGDYYPLTEYTSEEDAWMAYQLNLPREHEGLVVILKRPKSTIGMARFVLRGLGRAATYDLTDLDSKHLTHVKGSLLTFDGFEIRLDKAPDSALIHYRRG